VVAEGGVGGQVDAVVVGGDVEGHVVGGVVHGNMARII
jgi:hypothetical protein